MYSHLRFNPAWSLVAALSLCLVSGVANAGPKAYVGNFKDNTVSVIDTSAGTVVATVPIAAGPHGMVITPDGRRLFVSSDGSSAMSVIDTIVDRVTGTVEVGKSPHGVALVPGKDLLLVAVNGEDKVAFVDTAKLAVVATVGIGKPHTIGVSPDGKAAYVSSQVPGHFAVAIIDLAGRTVLRTVPLDKTPRDLEYSFDGKVYFTEAGANAVMVLDPASDKIVAEIPTGVSPHYVNHPRNTMFGMAIVQGPGELLLFDPKTGKPVRSIKVGDQPHWLAVSGDGKTAYVTNEGSNTLSIVDIASGKTVTIAVGNQPRKVVVQTLTAGATVSIVNFAFQPQVVTIAPGDSVLWTNRDGGPHAVAFKDGSDGSDTLFPGKTFSRTFERTGSYDYFCSIHAYMTGRVEVRKQ
jgi:YVTN family beta-propeller protein